MLGRPFVPFALTAYKKVDPMDLQQLPLAPAFAVVLRGGNCQVDFCALLILLLMLGQTTGNGRRQRPALSPSSASRLGWPR